MSEYTSINLGNVQGPQGPTGYNAMQYSGTAITGTSTTPSLYDTGITDAHIGDQYYYNGTAATDIGNVYICSLGGNEATALWVYDRNIRGASAGEWTELGTASGSGSAAPIVTVTGTYREYLISVGYGVAKANTLWLGGGDYVSIGGLSTDTQTTTKYPIFATVMVSTRTLTNPTFRVLSAFIGPTDMTTQTYCNLTIYGR